MTLTRASPLTPGVILIGTITIEDDSFANRIESAGDGEIYERGG